MLPQFVGIEQPMAFVLAIDQMKTLDRVLQHILDRMVHRHSRDPGSIGHHNMDMDHKDQARLQLELVAWDLLAKCNCCQSEKKIFPRQEMKLSVKRENYRLIWRVRMGVLDILQWRMAFIVW